LSPIELSLGEDEENWGIYLETLEQEPSERLQFLPPSKGEAQKSSDAPQTPTKANERRAEETRSRLPSGLGPRRELLHAKGKGVRKSSVRGEIGVIRQDGSARSKTAARASQILTVLARRKTRKP